MPRKPNTPLKEPMPTHITGTHFNWKMQVSTAIWCRPTLIFLQAIAVECSGYTLGSAVATRYAASYAGKTIWDKMKTPNRTLVAETDIAVESLAGETTVWYFAHGDWFIQWKYDEDYASSSNLNGHYEYHSLWVNYIQWIEDEERYRSTDAFWRFGGIYLADCLNDAYNNGWPGDEDTGKKGYYITGGTAEMNHLTHVFDSEVNEWDADPDLEDRSFTYNPEVHADISDMRYEMQLDRYGREESPGWTYTPRADETVRIASDIPADEDATQTVDLLSLSSRLDNYRMRNNKSKLYWKRTTKEISAGHPATATFSDGSTMPTNMPTSSTWRGLLPFQKISTSN